FGTVDLDLLVSECLFQEAHQLRPFLLVEDQGKLHRRGVVCRHEPPPFQKVCFPAGRRPYARSEGVAISITSTAAARVRLFAAAPSRGPKGGPIARSAKSAPSRPDALRPAPKLGPLAAAGIGFPARGLPR